MTIDEIASRLNQIERALQQARIHLPAALTAEERAGAPMRPWENPNYFPFATLGEPAKDRLTKEYDEAIAAWRREHT